MFTTFTIHDAETGEVVTATTQGAEAAERLARDGEALTGRPRTVRAVAAVQVPRSVAQDVHYTAAGDVGRLRDVVPVAGGRVRGLSPAELDALQAIASWVAERIDMDGGPDGIGQESTYRAARRCVHATARMLAGGRA